MTWSHVSQLYLQSFRKTCEERSSQHRPLAVRTLDEQPLALPQMHSEHLQHLSDSTGIVQHAVYTIPDHSHGYCTDDNARALHIKRTGIVLSPNKQRVALRAFQPPGNDRILRVIARVSTLAENEVDQLPTNPWEYVQMGNCGSPIETPQGWLVLTHGVAPMRKYCIGAMLLDLENPAKIIARLQEPLITPNEREGYVPNVVYTCGAILHHNQLVIPYAMSDYATTFATVQSVGEVVLILFTPEQGRRFFARRLCISIVPD